MLQCACQQLVTPARVHALHGRRLLVMRVGQAFLLVHFFAIKRDQFM
jgi:hypothetical protein